MAREGVSRDGDGMERGGMGWGRRCPALTAAPSSPPAPQNFWATLAAVGAPRPPCPRGDPGAGPHVMPPGDAPLGCRRHRGGGDPLEDPLTLTPLPAPLVAPRPAPRPLPLPGVSLCPRRSFGEAESRGGVGGDPLNSACSIICVPAPAAIPRLRGSVGKREVVRRSG